MPCLNMDQAIEHRLIHSDKLNECFRGQKQLMNEQYLIL